MSAVFSSARAAQQVFDALDTGLHVAGFEVAPDDVDGGVVLASVYEVDAVHPAARLRITVEVIEP